MKNKRLFPFILTAISLLTLLAQAAGGYSYSSGEFERRRQALMNSAGSGFIILFASPGSSGSGHFRQDNDFFYFTGSEDANAILVMIPATRESYLFVPPQTEREKMMEGANSLADPGARERFGVKEIYPVGYFDEFLARNLGQFDPVFYLRLSPEDSIGESRSEKAIFTARRHRNPYNTQLPLNQFRTERFRQLYPEVQLKDITPLIDGLRMIKSQEEIAVLRKNGKVSAEAVKKAMLTSKPGAYEYELEAAAMEVVLINGGRGPAYPPIIGSGPNTCILHYEKNSRQMQAGELVLMDFAGELDYLTMDITRTWPVSGKFAEEQKKIYRTVLEVQKACIEAFKPGATARDVEEYVGRKMKEKGIDPMGLRGGLGHLVGLSVHDVRVGDFVLQEGMVMAIEPGLYFSEKNIGIRIEDTVLITRDGCEVLTADVPKEIEEIETLLARRKF
jgi:Xaa-Pro aminopeptidase